MIYNVISPVVDKTPGRDDVEALFHQAWQSKCEWAKQLIITEKSKATRTFSKVARKIGMTIHTVDLSELEPMIGHLKDSFEVDANGFHPAMTRLGMQALQVPERNRAASDKFNTPVIS